MEKQHKSKIKLADSEFYRLPQNIKTLRENSGETMEELALAIGLSNKSSISQYESGERKPSRDALIMLAKRYGVTLDALLYSEISKVDWALEETVRFSELDIRVALNRFFPIVITSNALENEDFKVAYELQKKIQSVITDGKTCEDLDVTLDKCATHYTVACESDVAEAAANYLSLILGLYIGYIALADESVSDTLDEYKDWRSGIKNDEIKQLFKRLCLTEFIEEMCRNRGLEESIVKEKISNDRELARKCFYIDNFELLLWLIGILKHSGEYCDLGDYYLALLFKLKISAGNRSDAMNSAIGDALMSTLSSMGNEYARIFIEG